MMRSHSLKLGTNTANGMSKDEPCPEGQFFELYALRS